MTSWPGDPLENTFRTWFSTWLAFFLEWGCFPWGLWIHQGCNNILWHRDHRGRRRSRGTNCPCRCRSPSEGEEPLWVSWHRLSMMMNRSQWSGLCWFDYWNGWCRFQVLRRLGFQELPVQVRLQESLICIGLEKALNLPLSSIKCLYVCSG